MLASIVVVRHEDMHLSAMRAAPLVVERSHSQWRPRPSVARTCWRCGGNGGDHASWRLLAAVDADVWKTKGQWVGRSRVRHKGYPCISGEDETGRRLRGECQHDSTAEHQVRGEVADTGSSILRDSFVQLLSASNFDCDRAAPWFENHGVTVLHIQ
jgi:hypothetical protein